MPSDGFTRPTGPKKKLKRKPITQSALATRAPVTDAQSSGRNYGTAKAKAFKKTAIYKRSVGAAKPVRKTDATSSGPGYGKTRAESYKRSAKYRTDLLRDHAAAEARGAAAALRFLDSLDAHDTQIIRDEYQRTHKAPDGTLPHAGGSAAAMLAMAPGKTTASRLVIGPGQTAIKHPGETVSSLGKTVVGTVGAVGDVMLPLADATVRPWKVVEDVKKAGEAAGRLGKGAAEDVKRRYGWVVKGDDASYEANLKRMEKEGAGPELIDLAGATAVGTKVIRPAVRGAIKLHPKGKALLEAPRPDLRTSGGKVEKQTVSEKPLRVVAQRTQDKVRAYATDHPGRVLGRRHRPDADERTTALRPRVSPNDKAALKSIKRHNKKAAARGRRPVTAGPEVVPLSRRLTNRKQRVAVSRVSARAYVANKHEQAVELSTGAERALAGLDAKQRRATFHVIQGLVPLHRSVPEIKAALRERRAQLVKAGAPKGAKVLRSRTELATVDFLIKHTEAIFGDGRLRDFHAGEVERGKRIAEGDPALRSATQEARRYRPQGELLGEPYRPPQTRTVAGKKVHPTPGERDAYNRAYVERVKTKAAAAHLPEPAYFKHEKRPQLRLAARTGGNVGKASVGPKQSKMVLLREGRAVTSPDMYVQGLAETIKRKHQWAAVADVAEEHAFPWSRGKAGEGRSISELRDLIDRQGLRHDDVAFINFGRFRRIAEELDDKTANSPKHFGAAVEDAVMTAERADLLDRTGDLPATRGYVAVPRAAADEILAATRPSGKPTRIFGKAQGLQSAAILGLNPSWLQMQVAANMLQSGVGMRGNLLDFARAQAWYRKLTPEAKKHVDQHLGIGVYEGHTNAAHLGYHQGPVSKAFERVGQIPLIRTKRGAVRVTDANPVHLMFRADRVQNSAFRRAVLFNELKRQQFRDMARDIGHAQAAVKQVSGMLKGNAADQLAHVLSDPHKVEAAARYVDEVLGDYLRYTATERRYFKPYVMFYGFLRYALKTLFYTLPVKHPALGAITLKLGQLHNEEVYRIFGSREVPEWALSRSYEYDENGEVKRDEKGRPMYRDLARINPLTSAVTEVITEGPQVLAGMVSPLFQGAVDVIAGESVATHIPLRVHGSTAKAEDLSPLDIAKIVLNRVAKSTFPGRVAMAGHGTQGDDALPFLPAPLEYKTEAGRQRDLQRTADQPSLAQQLAPLFVARADTTQDFMNRHDIGPVGKLKEAIDILGAHKDALEKSGQHVENGDYPTLAYENLKDGIAELRAIRSALVNEPKAKPKARLRQRPKSSDEKLNDRLQQQLDRLEDPEADLNDKINRQLERLQVQGGG